MPPPSGNHDEHVRIPLKDILSLHARRFSPKKKPRLRVANLEKIVDTYQVNGSTVIEKLKTQEFTLKKHGADDETGTTSDGYGEDSGKV